MIYFFFYRVYKYIPDSTLAKYIKGKEVKTANQLSVTVVATSGRTLDLIWKTPTVWIINLWENQQRFHHLWWCHWWHHQRSSSSIQLHNYKFLCVQRVYKVDLRLPIALPLDELKGLTPFDELADKVHYLFAKAAAGNGGLNNLIWNGSYVWLYAKDYFYFMFHSWMQLCQRHTDHIQQQEIQKWDTFVLLPSSSTGLHRWAEIHGSAEEGSHRTEPYQCEDCWYVSVQLTIGVSCHSPSLSSRVLGLSKHPLNFYRPEFWQTDLPSLCIGCVW